MGYSGYRESPTAGYVPPYATVRCGSTARTPAGSGGYRLPLDAPPKLRNIAAKRCGTTLLPVFRGNLSSRPFFVTCDEAWTIPTRCSIRCSAVYLSPQGMNRRDEHAAIHTLTLIDSTSRPAVVLTARSQNHHTPADRKRLDPTPNAGAYRARKFTARSADASRRSAKSPDPATGNRRRATADSGATRAEAERRLNRKIAEAASDSSSYHRSRPPWPNGATLAELTSYGRKPHLGHVRVRHQAWRRSPAIGTVGDSTSSSPRTSTPAWNATSWRSRAKAPAPQAAPRRTPAQSSEDAVLEERHRTQPAVKGTAPRAYR